MSVIRFFSEAAGEVIMLRSTVEPIMKQAEIVFHDNGAFLAEDLPEFIEKIQKTINDLVLLEQAPQDNDDDQDEEIKQKCNSGPPPQRRLLLELMNKALKKGKHVYWSTL